MESEPKSITRRNFLAGAAVLAGAMLTGALACNMDDDREESLKQYEDLQRKKQERESLATWEAERPTPDTRRLFPAPTATPAGYGNRTTDGTGWGP